MPGIQDYKVEKATSNLVIEVKALTDTIVRAENKLIELNKHIEIQGTRIMLHNSSISAIIDTFQIMSRWMQTNNSVRSKLKKSVNKMIVNLQKWQRKLEADKHTMSSPSESSFQTTNTNSNTNNMNNEREADLDEKELQNSIENNA